MRVPIWAGVFAILLCAARTAEGQTLDRVEVTAFGGYRFGGEFYEIASGLPVDTDGAPAFGVVLNIPFTRETQIEALITHQQARFTLPGADGAQGTRLRVTVDHYQVGGLSELGSGRARPFLTGLLGLTRYEASGDHEVPHLGVRGRRGETVPGAARRPAPGRTRVRDARRRRCGCAGVQPGHLRRLHRRLARLAGGVHGGRRGPVLILRRSACAACRTCRDRPRRRYDAREASRKPAMPEISDVLILSLLLLGGPAPAQAPNCRHP